MALSIKGILLETPTSRDELRGQKKKIKRAIRRKRKELSELEESLLLVSKQEKNMKQMETFSKYRHSIFNRVRKGEFRLTRDKVIQLITEEEDEIL